MNWLLRGLLHHVYMDQADDGTSGGGAAGAAAGDQGQGSAAAGADAGGQQAAGQSGAGTEGGAGDKNILQTGQGEPAQTAQVQEKYIVKKEDGSVDWEASALKQAQGYSELSKRLGTGDAAPKSVEDYQITVPDTLKDVWNPKEDAELGDFLKEAHAAGFTQKQIDLALAKYLDVIPKLAGGVQQLNADDCVAELKQTWKTDQEYNTGVSAAFKAAQGFFGNDAEYIIKTYGNDARLIRGLAKIGAEMGEDSSLNPSDALPHGSTIEELLAHPAYSDPKHAEHAKVSKQVADYYARQSKAQERTGNVPIM